MTDVFVNGVGWVDVPEGDPLCGIWPAGTWTDRDTETIRILSDDGYPLERIAWTVGRTIPAIQERLRKIGTAA